MEPVNLSLSAFGMINGVVIKLPSTELMLFVITESRGDFICFRKQTQNREGLGIFKLTSWWSV